ncbi:GTPase Era, mitochondrial [Bombyx mandarina]|uniref:GTPase Era, mitochondrial n=1 Tax=Bombyx mandarina TaxID=7092 RepID=A0A6J2KCB9_BOMMA|nr:GTPase Era, mitochondrial [Bombyx mandarina]
MATITRGMCVFSYLNMLPRRIVNYSFQPQHAENKNIGKIVHVAIVGAPNSGKSTLINKIIDRKICAASNKVHTTTKLVRAMCYCNDTQIVFLDTPGVVTDREQKKYNLPPSMLGSCHKSLRCADVVGVVHDASCKYIRESLHKDVVEMLNSVQDMPSFLIINKVDKLRSKKQLLTLVRNLTNGFIAGNPIPGPTNPNKQERGFSHFSDVFMVSALNGDGVSDIREYLVNNAKPGKFHYSTEEWTDQTPKSVIEDAVRAKFLDFLHQEIPYNLKVKLDYYEEIDNEDKIICSVSVECPSERLMRLISGAGGGRLQQIKSSVRNDLIDVFRKTVILDLQLHVKNNFLLAS